MFNLAKRWKAETPILFKNIIKLCVTLITICTSLLALTAIVGVLMPLWLQKVCSNTLIISTVVSILSKLATHEDITKPDNPS